MTSWNPRANELFLSARGLSSPEERNEFLDRVCAGDAALRAEAESLLAADDRAEGFLQSPVPAQTIDLPSGTGGAGTIIGPYKLLEQIGEGGFGVVYMAEQTHPVRRKVALKVLKPGMDTRQVVARFEAERQALAIMDHPNIAKVFDGGATDSGRPFFVMELVKGVTVTDFCDRNHLTPRQRLELFVPVCQAIQHAHQKGIIHRDIKPSNVLVTVHDTTPVVKVIDFGVAKALGQELTEKTLFTGFAQMIGTPLYMSPEQAGQSGLDVDTRSDIYSLGVLLYELLTGTTPFDKTRFQKAAYDEIRRIIREEEPPKPSTRLSELSGPHAPRADAGTRSVAPASSLASVAALRHTEPARLTRLVRGELDWIVMKALEKDRNRRYETANGFAADVQRYLNDEPVQACPPSASYRFRKFARRNKVAIGVAGMVLFFLVLLGSGAGWALRDREAREQEIAREAARKQALTEQGIRQALDRGAASRAELHAMLRSPGGVQQLLNQPARWELWIKTAHGELAQARQLAGRAEGELDSESTRAMDEFEKQLTSDQVDYDLARRLEKIRLDRATLLVNGRFEYRVAADDYSKAFAGLAVLTDDPAVAAVRITSSPIKDQLVAALDDWAWVVFLLRREELAERLLAVARQAAPDPAFGDRVRQLKVWRDREALGKLVAQAPAGALSPQLLSLVGLRLRDTDQEESWLRRAQADHPTDFWLNFELGGALMPKKPVEAAGFYRVALVVRPGSSSVYLNIGAALELQKKLPEAVTYYRKAIEFDPKDARATLNIGLALQKQGKPDEAIAWCHKAMAIDPKYADVYNVLGLILDDQKKPDAAIAAFQKAIELDPEHPHAHSNLGNDLARQGKFDQAIDCCHKALKINSKNLNAYITLGICLRRQKKLEEAIRANQDAIKLDRNCVDAHINLGNVLRDQGNLDEAITCYREAIRLDSKNVTARGNFGDALGEKGWQLVNNPDPKLRDPKQAVAVGKEAVELVPESVNAWQYLGWVQYRAGNWKASIEALKKSCKLQKGGDACQWIVMALAHGQLAGEENLTAEERTQHKAEARRLYDEAAKQINGWAPGGASLKQAARAFRAEATELLGANQVVKSLEMLVAAQPNAWEPRVNLAQAYAKEGQWEEAAAQYTKATEVKPDAWEPWSRRAFFHLNRKQWDSAAADFSKAIDLAPQVHTNWWHRGHAYIQLERWDKVAADFGVIVERWPDGAEGWYWRAVAFAQLKQPDKAIADLRQAIAKGFKRTDWLGSDKRLDPLRSNDEFKKLCALLEKKEK